MEASQADKHVFGADTKLHPITNMPLESGVGHAPDEVQAWAHCDTIEHEHGRKAADAMRAKLTDAAKNPEDPALTRAKVAAEHARNAADAAKADFEAKAKLAAAADAKVKELGNEKPDEPAVKSFVGGPPAREYTPRPSPMSDV